MGNRDGSFLYQRVEGRISSEEFCRPVISQLDYPVVYYRILTSFSDRFSKNDLVRSDLREIRNG